MTYRVAQPDLSGNEERYVLDALQSTWISSQGPYLKRFERQVADYVGVPYAVATANGTVALHLAMLALDVGPGDEVIVPSLTYVATANAVRYCGATPVFADSDPASWCVSVRSVEKLITPRTRGIIVVHLFGQPCDMAALTDLAKAHRLWIVEDAAEALGTQYGRARAGGMSDVATFSFYGNKTVTTGEGGMVVTPRADLAARVRLLHQQGRDANRSYWHDVLGYNYRMTNLAAAIGVAQMERLDEFLARRRRLVERYRQRLRDVDVTLPADIPDTVHGNWMFGLLVSEATRRDELMRALAERHVETRPFFHPVHEFPMYAGCRTDEGCPVACDLGGRGVCLPTSSMFGEDDADVIADHVLAALGMRAPLAAAA
jgi:perosamine synthetase